MSQRKRPKIKIKRDQADLSQSLVERIDLLITHAEKFDQGSTHFAKVIAADLYVLLLDSLLAKLRILDQIKYYDTAVPYKPDNVFPHHGLVVVNEAGAFAMFDDIHPKPRAFESWKKWSSATVMFSHEGALFSRKKIIQDMRHFEGSHEDYGLPPEYHALTRGPGIGYHIKDNKLAISFEPNGSPVNISGEYAWLPNPMLSFIRQIAHEVLVSLAASYPSAFPSKRVLRETLRHHEGPRGLREIYRKRTTENTKDPITWTYNKLPEEPR